MAEVVDEMPEPRQKGSVYSWSKWFDGQVWRLSRGVDFNTTTATFVNNCHAHASSLGGKVITRRAGDDVFVQFRLGDPK